MNLHLILLLIANLIFYAFLDLRALPVLIGLSLLTYLGGRIIFSLKRKSPAKNTKPICLAFIAVQIAVLCLFKYSSALSLPVGMSFYMLMAISFLADVQRDEFGELPSVLHVLVYITFFPTVISGPIMKAKELIPQFSSRKKLTRERCEEAAWMIVIGAFMKLAMADRIAVSVNSVYSAPLVYSGPSLFMASIGYTLQLLFDFAGYSFMAFGAAELIGYDITKNFNLPYIAKNPSEFWRRWHISLSSWLKDYVYIPLGGSRKGKMRTYLNIFIVMAVSGLWHGSTFNFFVWGMLHGLGQVVHRLFTKGMKKDASGPAVGIFSSILNFLFVSFLWIPFRLPIKDAWTVFLRIITFSAGASYYYVYTFIFAAALLVVQLIGVKYSDGNDPIRPLPLSKLYGRVIFCIMIIATAMFAYFGSGAFIYAKF
ncbi:MAG: hypothetical protein K6F73_08875 [Lachnospiraceae bacterium]|nr:hypothetical protein [Lachnospiraceae bacterium]